MLQIHSLTSQETELGLFHGGLLFIAPGGQWTPHDAVQLTAKSARELANALNKWADDDDKLVNKYKIEEVL